MFKYRIKTVTTHSKDGTYITHYPQYSQGVKFLFWFIPFVEWQSISGDWEDERGYADFNCAKWDLERFIEETEQRYKETEQTRKKKDTVKYTYIKGELNE